MRNSTIYLSVLLALFSTNVLAADRTDIPKQSQNDRDSTNRAEMLKLDISNWGDRGGGSSDNEVPSITVKTRPGTCPNSFPLGGQVWASIDNGSNWILVSNTCHIINTELRERECDNGQPGKITTKREIKDFQDGSRSDETSDWEESSNTCGTGVPEEPTAICEGRAPGHASLDYVLLPAKPGEYYGRICYVGPTDKYMERFAESMSNEPIDQRVSRNKLVPGQIGGQVQSYSNLFETGVSNIPGASFVGWVAEQAIVGGSSLLYKNAQLSNNAVIVNTTVNNVNSDTHQNAYIYGNADVRNTTINAVNAGDKISVRIFGNTRIDKVETETIRPAINGGSVLYGNVNILAGDNFTTGSTNVMSVEINDSNISGNVKIVGKSQITRSYIYDGVKIGEPGEYINSNAVQLVDSTVNGSVEIQGNVSIDGSVINDQAKVFGGDWSGTGVNSITVILDSIVKDGSIIGNRTLTKIQPKVENSKIEGDSIVEGDFVVRDSEVLNSKLASVLPNASAAQSAVYNNSKISDSTLIKVQVANSIVKNYTVPGTSGIKALYSRWIDGETNTTNPPPETP